MKADIIAALAGSYSLLNTTVVTPNGTVTQDQAYGAAPVGMLHYTPEGYMSATITATEPEWRPLDLTFPSQANQSDAEWAALGRHLLCYAGPLQISDAIPANSTSGQVIHGPLVVAAIPAWVGTSQARNYTVFEDPNGDTILRLQAPRPTGMANIFWRKLPSRVEPTAAKTGGHHRGGKGQ
ncbi:hypothetical protein KVR01_006243 [Diaporthe batatas]|uniref:uncharacterized protein n=1 Tax=Diaporthe batatas TaxID=748121 RepID=UPI001D048EFB|nr:uncharacterized protein KVR01_006243 [Diaporthe batatas]KAG8164325.1 hypothetical protein KVR01_006243 [Diaporthe batatas]